MTNSTKEQIMFLPAIDTPIMPGTNLVVTHDYVAGSGIQEGGAIFSKDMIHRYVLWRIWDRENLPLVVIGLNPSTATEMVLDNTCRRDVGYAKQWGYGGLVKLNLHSYRSTDPSVMYDWAKEHGQVNPDPITGGMTNDDYIRWFCSPRKAGLVLAAWGNHGKLFSRGWKVKSMLADAETRVHALKVTKLGYPQHTLYLKADLIPFPYT